MTLVPAPNPETTGSNRRARKRSARVIGPVGWPTRIRLVDADDALIEGCVTACADAYGPKVPAIIETMHLRRAAAEAGLLPSTVDLLVDLSGPVGWMGWALYGAPELATGGQLDPSVSVWESTTAFASRWRGTGLFEQARCWQVHRLADLETWAAQSGVQSGVVVPPTVALVSSIALTNERSLRASTGYAARHGLTVSLTPVWEPHRERDAYLLRWPDPATWVAAHTCPTS